MNNKLYKGSIFALYLSMGLCSNLDAMSGAPIEQHQEEGKIQSLATQLAQSQLQINQLTAQVNELVGTVTGLQARVDELKEENINTTEFFIATLISNIELTIGMNQASYDNEDDFTHIALSIITSYTYCLCEQLKGQPEQKKTIIKNVS